MTVHAHTDVSGPLPAYINISELHDSPGDVRVTVRSAGANGSGIIVLTSEQLHNLVKDASKFLADYPNA